MYPLHKFLSVQVFKTNQTDHAKIRWSGVRDHFRVKHPGRMPVSSLGDANSNSESS